MKSDTSDWRVHNSVLKVIEMPSVIASHIDIFCDLFRFYDLISISADDIKGAMKGFLGDQHSSYIKFLYLNNASVDYSCKKLRGTLKRDKTLFNIGVVFNFLFSCDSRDNKVCISDIYMIRFKYVLPGDIINKYFLQGIVCFLKMYHCLDLELRGIHTGYDLDRFKLNHNLEECCIESSYNF